MDLNKLLKNLEANTIKDLNTGCWLFQGCKDSDGYGMISRGNYVTRMIRVHRLSANIFLKLDLRNHKQKALHKIICLNKNCWNPDHLYVGTNEQNIRDAVITGTHYIPKYSKTGRKERTHCRRGHELTKENVYYNNSAVKCCRICRLQLQRKSRGKATNS